MATPLATESRKRRFETLTPRPTAQFISLALLVGIALFYLAFLKPGIWGFDGSEALQMSQSLITKGNLTIAPDSGGVEGVDGQFYSIRYPLLPIVAVPFVGIGMAIADTLNLPVQYVSATCGLVLNVLLTAGTAVLVWLTTIRLGGKSSEAYLAAIGFAFGTVALAYAREFFSEPLLAFLMTLALYLAFGQSKVAHLGASALVMLAIAAKPAGIVLAPVLCLYFLVKRFSGWEILAPGIGAALGVGCFLFYNYIRFGRWLASGQDTARFGLEGFGGRALGQLVSPGAGGGLFLYCPPTVLALIGFGILWQKRRPEALALCSVFLGFWLLHSAWDFRGWNWGPRFLVPIIPSMMVFVGLLGRRWRMPILGLILLGFVVNAPTLVAFYQRHFAELSDQSMSVLMQNLELWNDPAQSPLIKVWGATGRQLQDAFTTPVQEIVMAAGAPPAAGQLSKSELLRIVAVWWWFLPIAGIPIWVGLAIAVVMVLMAVWLLKQGWLASLKFKRSTATKSGQP